MILQQNTTVYSNKHQQNEIPAATMTTVLQMNLAVLLSDLLGLEMEAIPAAAAAAADPGGTDSVAGGEEDEEGMADMSGAEGPPLPPPPPPLPCEGPPEA